MEINYKQSNIVFEKGSVILAGAGPGCVEQVTLKVYAAISKADVIIYDSLVNENILKNANKSTIKIFGGKTKSKRACSQNEINEWMIHHTKKNRKVLRLKGGDPSFFSRGSQEIEFLEKNKIKYKVFSGITSSQPAIKKTNISFFNQNDICNFITGHRRIKNNSISLDLKKIVGNEGRIIIYMGVSQIKKISSDLIDLGVDHKTKVFIVSNASMQSERVFQSSLFEIEKTIDQNNILPPSIIVIN
jgi:uroporphyrin-III C-methyltransferase